MAAKRKQASEKSQKPIARKKTAKTRPAKKTKSPASANKTAKSFPIVGIGASAGGLEAIRLEAINEKNRLEAVLAALPVGMSIVDEKGGNPQTNKAFEQIWGGPRPPAKSIKDYVKYKAWWADTGKPVKPEEWASAQAVKKGKTVTGQLLEIERFDGSRAYVLNSAAPILDADGKIAGSAVAIQDITELRKAQEELRRSEEKFHSLFKEMSEAVVLFELIRDEKGKTVDCRVLDANPSVEKMTGITPANTIGLTMRQIFPDTDEFWFDTYGKVERTGKPVSFERRFEPLDRFYHTCVYRPAAGQIAIVFTDITNRKKTELALEQSEKKYRSLFSTMTEGFALHEIICDKKGWPCDYRFLEVNPAFETLTALKSKDIVGKTVKEIMPDIEPFWIETYGQVALTGESKHIENFSKTLGRHYEIFAYRPAPKHFAVVFIDITDRKKAEQALQESNEELSRFNRAAVGRELRMIELKKEVNYLCEQAGLPPRYPLDFDKENDGEKNQT